MSDNLTIFGNVYEGVNTLTFTDTNNQQKVYINTADADATAADILSGKTAYVQGNKIIGTGSSSASAKDVNFRDYDGTITNSYTKEEFAALTEMPANPTQKGLIAQGWNWNLADAKAYVAKYGRLEIGQMYITDDGKTRVYIHLEKGRTSPMLGCCPNGTVDVDWGDGTEHDILTGTSTTTVQWTSNHNYAEPGDYVIKLTVSGSMGLYGTSSVDQCSGLLRYNSWTDKRNRVYQNAIQRVEIGSGITSIENTVFFNCYSLLNISIPDGVTSIGSNTFNDCYNLSNINIPNSVISIGTAAFYFCASLSNLSLPNSVISIGIGAFNCCYSLQSASIPDVVASIENYVFNNCYSLSNLNIPDSVTSIGENAVNCCYSLSNLNIPDSVTSIGASAFQNCYSVAEYHLAPTTPPTLANTNAFSSILNDCIIYVPYSEDHSILEAYKTATNWSTYADYMQEEPI